MLTHTQIWAGLDRLAERFGLTPSGLAKLAGLDPTAFNRSKRVAPGAEKARWPSTESLAKVLDATGVSFEEFASLASGRARGSGRGIPLLGFAQAGERGFFDDAGFPAGTGWDEIAFPTEAAEGVYALEVTGASMIPVYRPGDRLIVAPGQETRRGDRVVVKTTAGEVMAKELGRATARSIELVSLNPDFPVRTLDVEDIAWIARVLWASQ